MSLFIEIFLIGVGLSMDAFAVSICKGLSMQKVKKRDVFIIALFFGGFQALMPFIGWFLGRGFESYITSIDHWISFILLSIIGGKMLIDGIKAEDDEDEGEFKLDLKELFLLAIATSIDALAVGITFAFLDYPIVECMSIIGCTTFIISFIGVYIGKVFGSKYEHKAEIAGGIILIVIGLKILLEHLGLFSRRESYDKCICIIISSYCWFYFINERSRFFCRRKFFYCYKISYSFINHRFNNCGHGNKFT